MHASIEILPHEIWREILQHVVPGKNLYLNKRVCKIFLKVINNYILRQIPVCFKTMPNLRDYEAGFTNKKYISFINATLLFTLQDNHSLRIVYQEIVKDPLENILVTTELTFANNQLIQHRRLSFCSGEEKKNGDESYKAVIDSINNKRLKCEVMPPTVTIPSTF